MRCFFTDWQSIYSSLIRAELAPRKWGLIAHTTYSQTLRIDYHTTFLRIYENFIGQLKSYVKPVKKNSSGRTGHGHNDISMNINNLCHIDACRCKATCGKHHTFLSYVHSFSACESNFLILILTKKICTIFIMKYLGGL